MDDWYVLFQYTDGVLRIPPGVQELFILGFVIWALHKVFGK